RRLATGHLGTRPCGRRCDMPGWFRDAGVVDLPLEPGGFRFPPLSRKPSPFDPRRDAHRRRPANGLLQLFPRRSGIENHPEAAMTLAASRLWTLVSTLLVLAGWRSIITWACTRAPGWSLGAQYMVIGRKPKDSRGD